MSAAEPLEIPATPWLDLVDAAAEIHVDVPDLPELRRVAQRTWIGRMVNEHASGRVFDQLADQIEVAGTDRERVAQCREFAAEERRHGALCAAVARALGAEPRAARRVEGDLPKHADAISPLEAAMRNVLSISCLSETVAVTIITAEREQMPDGDVKRILSQILADEIGHARFGWGWVGEALPTLGATEKAALSRYLSIAFAHVEAHELTHLPDTGAPPPGAEAVGVCSGREARSLFYETIEEVVVPRLSAFGLDAHRAWIERPRA